MIRRFRHTVAIVVLGVVAAIGCAGCDETDSFGGFGFDGLSTALGTQSSGDYYYGFYDSEGTGSFSLYPGGDPGDSLSTYLGNSIVY
ncbi:MAG: hypothetical protein U1D55_01355 [Phycisphaerae bacterium]